MSSLSTMRGKQMHVPRGLTRLRLSLVACLVLVASAAVLVGTAGAQTDGGGLPPGPQLGLNGIVGTLGAGFPAFNPTDANIPTLAWRGEEVRLVKCNPAIPQSGSVIPNQTVSGFF